MNNQTLGQYGEDLAARYLLDRAYEILERNYRGSYGEIDLIARQGDYLVFIEVKTRRSKNYGYAYEAVGPKKQEKILKTSLEYLLEGGSRDMQPRYDIIEVYILGGQITINHIENSFTN